LCPSFPLAGHLLHSTQLRASARVRFTVLADTCMDADAWATALMVMGEKAGPDFARAHGMDAVFVLREMGHLTELVVGKFGSDREPTTFTASECRGR
jgi:thiamine biosynthesis lipoprotein ApbE